ncbi:PapB/FocB family fimbrial expression transcriptional regulator [Escherichia coli]|nr:hypothetical protein [Escherichia coli]EKQ7026124.1 hypothetical protein [Escherichia coli]EKQ7035957.1 hypothetical protein [Escherichia coli]KXQ91532.1 hypothetical protein AUQ17_23855 [Escherichia coli]
MGKKVKEKDALIQGKVSEFVFSSLMELSSVRSERVICAFRDFFVWGYTAYSALFDHGFASKSDQRFAYFRSTGNLTFSTAF